MSLPRSMRIMWGVLTTVLLLLSKAHAATVSIDCGGAAASPYVADTDYSGGATASVTNSIDTSLLTGTVPPQAVLQSNRYGTFTYTVPGFTAGSACTVTLYFAEEYWTASGKRTFDVSINGTQVLTNFDIYATAGAEYKAVMKTFNATANSSGQVVITTTNVVDNAQINGLVVATAASAPAAPTGLTASAGNSQVALSWSASTGATSYNVYRGTSAGGESTTAIATGLTGTTYTNTGLTDGTTYYYKVAAVNSSGTSGMSNEASATPTAPSTTIDINCGGSAASPYVADTDYSGGTATSVTNTITTTQLTGSVPPQAVLQSNRYGVFTYTIPGLTSGSSYNVTLYFAEEYWTASGKRVFDVSINGTQVLTNFDIYATAGAEYAAIQKSFSATANTSGQIVITTTNVTDNAQINGIAISAGSGGSAPSTPTGLTATAGNAQVALTWSASTGATSYNIYRSTTAGGEGTTAYKTGVTTASYTDTGLSNSTTYYYKVAAVNASGTSAQSAEASATPQPAVPSAPTGLAATAGNASVALSWTASTGATSYNVYRGTTAGGESATALASGLTGTTYTDSTAANGTTYYYTVKAVNSAGTSGASNEASAKPSAPVTVPSAPTGLAATAGNASVGLSWTASSGATSYNVYRGTTAGGESATALASGLTGTTYTDSTVANGTTYYYTVKAVNSAGTSGASNEASATPSAPVTGVDINCGGAAASPYVADTDYTGGTATSVTNTIDTSSLTGTVPPQAVLQSNRYGTFTYTIPGFTAGNSYTVTLYFAEEYWTAAGKRTFDVSINGTQVLTNFDIYATAGAEYKAVQESFTTTANSSGQIVIATTTVIDNAQINGIAVSGGSAGSTPSAPTGLTATAGNTQIGLAWTASTGATSYNVYRSTTSGGEGTTAVASGITGTTYTDTGLTNGTTYYYKVAAVNATGTSAQSTEASATPTATVTVPSAPTGLSATAGNTQVALSWTASSGATSYNVYRSTTSGGEGTTPIATGVTTTSYTNTGLTNGTTYYYKVAAVNSAGTSAQSTEASATPTATVTVPSAPTGLSATAGNAQVALGWTASTGATSYNVYRGATSGGESTTPIATGVTTASYTDTGVTNGTTYYYKVAAVNSAGTSAQSTEVSATPTATVVSYVPSGYALAWSDEFNQGVGNAPSSANWNYDTGIGPNNDGWGNWEQETYVNDVAHAHIIADSGALDGEALQIQATNDGDWATYGFHSARLNTTGKVQPTYGYIEIRAKLPSGQGIWPAFWALGNNINQVGWPACGEMDMVEMFGQNPTSEFASYHMGTSSSPIDWTQTVTSSTFQSQYHVYGLLWNSSGVTNYLDGVQFETHPSSSTGWVFNHPEFFILNLAVGGIPPGDVSQTGTTFPQNFDIDYIRVYEPGSGVGVAPAPSGLAAVATANQIAMTWTPSPGATSYNVYRGTTSGGESGTALATGVTVPNYTDSTVTNGTTYYYTVKAVNASGTSGASNEASGTPTVAPPNFGPNVYIFTPSTPASTIQTDVNNAFTAEQTNQFGTQRYAFLFQPGTYAVDVPVGFYTQVLGLGMTPDATTINGYVQVNAAWNGGNATTNFWRGVENLAVNPSDSGGTDEYAVSQACPMRRVHVKGNLLLADESVNPPGWASGGFLGDSLVDSQAESISQQQWLSRNSQWASWSNGVWNQVFVGCVNAPATSWPSPPYTNVGATPVIREKPFLNVDASGNYYVFVPSLKSNVTGVDWQTTQTGTNIPISQFYIAQSSTDNATTINSALSQGLNILFTPGVYALNGTITVSNPNTVILGIGMPTLQANTGQNAMQIADVDGVTVAGILFEAASSVNTLLQVGPSGSSASHSGNPTLLSDIFTRVGGAVAGSCSANVVINSNNVIGDDFWLWRADHGNSGTVGWTTNTSTNGLIVNGQNVTIYGLANEHHQGYQTLWNGNGGRTYFYQSEAPYDVPNQASWMDGTVDGFASYKVANTVTSHAAYGLGVYCYFNVDPSGVILQNAIEAPTAGSTFEDMVIVSLGGEGTINSVINGQGAAVVNNNGTANETSYLASYP